jgi:hypothetical protein
MSMCTWQKRCSRIRMGCTDAVGCLVTLARWQCWQSLHQKDTSEFMPSHTNLELTRQQVACVSGCATL